MNKDTLIAELREELRIANIEMCDVCKMENPSHSNCTWCPAKERRDKVLAQEADK